MDRPSTRGRTYTDAANLICICGHALHKHAQFGNDVNAPYECYYCECKRLRKDLQLKHVNELPKRDNA